MELLFFTSHQVPTLGTLYFQTYRNDPFLDFIYFENFKIDSNSLLILTINFSSLELCLMFLFLITMKRIKRYK